MASVTPSPRRSAFKRLGDVRVRGCGTNGASHHGIPLPPLYYQKRDGYEDDAADKQISHNSMRIKDPVSFLPEKREGSFPVSRTPFTTAKNTFVPIERPLLSRSNGTPPISPIVGKQHHMSTSPAPSLMSLSMTEDASEGSLTPSPTTSYLQVASISPYSGQNRHSGPNSHRFGCRSPTKEAFGAPLSPRKTPNKHYNQRRSNCMASPLPFSSSSHHSNICYSPGGSSIGSHSTITEDISRKQRVKTELCMHYTSGRICPFGSNCTYAHGEAELQMTKLMDLQRAGLIEDVEMYRTKPCLTWVTTGSCPFGKRCASIHDPRVVGPVSSWLPHTETQGNSMSTDINVDGLHQKRLAAIIHCNPFGENFSVGIDEFGDLYKLVCNTLPSNKRRRNNLSEIHKLAIAIEMRGGHNWMYKYRPQHVIYEELCMVLQKRAFRLEKSGDVSPIAINAFNPKNSQHVLVREIAFGPDSDSTVRGVALWFNIPEKEVSECTPQQAKRFRWKKPSKYDDKRALEKTPSVFDSRECFVMIRPLDHDAFDLATEMLRHRHAAVDAERLSTLSERFEALKELKKKKDALQKTFQNHKRSWINWAWPINVGRQSVDHETPVPPVDGPYNPLLDHEALEKSLFAGVYDEVEPVKGSSIEPLWNSFLSNCIYIKADENEAPPRFGRSLPIFTKLASGEEISPNRVLPHITRSMCDSSSTGGDPRTKKDSSRSARRQSEQCWKALLLENEGTHSINAWDMVREHFQNARCKKVLTIIQK